MENKFISELTKTNLILEETINELSTVQYTCKTYLDQIQTEAIEKTKLNLEDYKSLIKELNQTQLNFTNSLASESLCKMRSSIEDLEQSCVIIN